MKLGEVAPAFDLPLGAPPLAERQPVVLAFFASLAAPVTPSPRIRAELRGLGAALVLVSPAGLYVFRADDDVEHVDSKALLQLPQVAQSGLYLLDEHRVVRFAHEWDDERGLFELEDALAAAGRSMLSAPRRFGRREAVTTALIGAFVLAFVEGCGKKTEAPAVTTTTAAEPPPDIDVTLDVNGSPRKVKVDVRTTVLDALRERMQLTGTKKGCDHGQCGACTILVDDRRVLSCMLFAVQAEGSKITTIEGLATGDQLHPMQEAFVTEDALQCGYCTPGQIMSAVGLLKEKRKPNRTEIRQGMAGNICRCGAYTNIVAAIERAGRSAG